MVAVSVICADTDEQARWLSGPAALSFVRLRSGTPAPLASPEEAAAYPYSDQKRVSGQALGSPETVRQQLSSLLERTAADELMLTTMVYDIGDRVRSFELITEKVAGSLARPGA
jgi:alkanesulfonate monooxygenase SsuD/methylene tetrahydromethanopterin reductase-like flavin-dependent oxidoreductase (luciferase family)